MNITKLRIDGQFFYLDTSADVPALKELILAAATDGPRFIDFTAIGHGEVSVLMTPHLGVRFEVVKRTQDQVDEWEKIPPVVDFDVYSID